MSFGRRIAGPAPGVPDRSAPAPARTRRGGYWLGLLATAAASAATMAILPFISEFRLNGAALGDLLVPAALALLNVIAVAAVISLIVDVVLRALNWRRPWIYALVCAVVTLILYLFLAVAVGTINPVFALYVAVWPAAVGGWVLALYRR